MDIQAIDIGCLTIPLVTPFKTALRSVESLESIVVRIVTDCGMTGYGETAPTEAITGESRVSILEALEILSSSIVGRSLSDKEVLLQVVDDTVERSPNAKAAMEIALYDLWAQERGMPLYRYLGGERQHFKTGVTISLNPIEIMVEDVLKAVEQGFESLKIKLGDDPEEDLRRVEAISLALGESMSLKLDANQGWTKEETVWFLSALERRGIPVELIEQPVAREDIQGLKYIRQRSSIPLLADESVFSPEDAHRLLEEEAVDLINIKLDKCGGISKALEIADICHSYGVTCMMGCMMEGAISVGAAAHVASAKSETVTMFDLDAPILCREIPVIGGTCFSGADIVLDTKPGLGITGISAIEWLMHIS